MMFRYRDEPTARGILSRIKALGVNLRLMHVCGTHQDTLVRFGLQDMLRDVGIEIRQGPGCPVCVTTSNEVAEAIALVESGKTLAVFGDMLSVPTPVGSLSDAKARGGDVRVVYSVEDAVRMADLGKEVVFMAVGFETTSPSTASVIAKGVPENFTVLSCHRLLPPALDALFGLGEIRIDGLIEPGHVSTILGVGPYQRIAERWRIPQVIAGFEPLDILYASYMLAKQVAEGRVEVENEYRRVVRKEGNPRALGLIHRVFEAVDRPWRGFPVIPESALNPRAEFSGHDARVVHRNVVSGAASVEDDVGPCRCGEVLRGLIVPSECPLFGGSCRPHTPMGPCMVSREGSCNIEFRFSSARG